MVPKLSVTRIENISVAHRLNSPHLSEAANRELYGRCNNFNGHGHNYKLEVTVCGPIDQKTGMILNLSDLKNIIKAAVIDKFDHTNLDLDHPNYFAHQPSTTENFLLVIAEELKMEFQKRFSTIETKAIISKITLWETEKNIFTIEY